MQNFIVDISAPRGPLVLYAMQADSMSRFFSITVTDNGAPWEAPTGAAWTVRFGAPGMPAGWYDTITEPGGGTHPAVVVNENTATIEIAEQAISTAGQNILCVLVTDAQGYQIASWPFTLVVQGVPGLEAPEATVYYNALTAQVAETLTNAQAAANSAQAAANSASEAESFAQSINPSQFMTISQYGGSAAGVVAAADALHTARKIGLANFDGTADITVDQIGAVPKTGGEFSDIVRFYGPNYPQLGFMTVTKNSEGLYFAVCGEDRVYKDYIIKSLLSDTKISTSLNGESTQNIPKNAKVISNWKSITESGFYFAAAGSTGNPVSGVAFMGFIFIYEKNNHFGIGRACQGDYSANKLYFTNGYQIDNIKWVQM